jgi:enterochelin esterase family protein
MAPIFADGRFYTRSMTGMAAVDMAVADKLVQTEDEDAVKGVLDGAFAEFVAQLEQAEDKNALLDRFFSEHDRFPIIQGDDTVYFVYRGDHPDVGVYMGYVSRAGAQVLNRVAGTDFWYRGYKLPPDGRFEYEFEVGFEKTIADPLNDRIAPGTQKGSELCMPKWREPAYLTAKPARAGRVEEHLFVTPALDIERTVKVYLPHAYETRTDLPLVVVLGGGGMIEHGRTINALDNLMGKSMEPAVVVFDHFPGRRAWFESTTDLRHQLAEMIGEELVPWVRKRYAVTAERDKTAIVGFDLPGYGAMVTGLANAATFGKVATQSIYTHNTPMTDVIIDAIPSEGPKQAFFISWTRYGVRDIGEGTNLPDDNRRIAEALEKQGHRVTMRELDSGPGWGTWRTQLDTVFQWLLPLSQP